LTTTVLASDGLNVAQLKDWCREFQLKMSGNKVALKERLVEFSTDSSNWRK
jgi:hypothetical protein